MTHNGMRLCVREGFLSLHLIRRTAFNYTKNCPTKHFTPPDAVLRQASISLSCKLSPNMVQLKDCRPEKSAMPLWQPRNNGSNRRRQ